MTQSTETLLGLPAQLALKRNMLNQTDTFDRGLTSLLLKGRRRRLMPFSGLSFIPAVACGSLSGITCIIQSFIFHVSLHVQSDKTIAIKCPASDSYFIRSVLRGPALPLALK